MTKEMVDFAKSEAEIAAVIAHEISHVDLRHCIERFQYELLIRRILPSDLAAISRLPYTLLSISYSKQREREADIDAIVAVAKAGYHPARNLQAHYNIAPTDPVEVVRQDADGARELISTRWGLVPWWWNKPLKQSPASFNMRAETVANKPMFRDAFQRSRCIIPASGYFEWLKRPDGRQPYFISAADGGVLSFAGLWDRWKNPETGERIASCTIIVTDANELTRPIHDRMPVVLDKANTRPWLNGESGTELLRPAGEHCLRMWPVSRRVNKTGTGDDDPSLIDEVAVKP